MNDDEMYQLFSPYVATFVRECGDVKYEERGISNVEAFYWFSMVGIFKPDTIFETGVYKARSTEILARAQRYYGVRSHLAFDRSPEHEAYVREKMKGYATKYSIRDGYEALNKVLSSPKHSKILVIMDGPKSGDSFESMIKDSLSNDKVCGMGIHDCSEKSGSKHYLRYVQKRFEKRFSFYYADNKLSERFEYLNDPIRQRMSELVAEEIIERISCVGLILDAARVKG